MAEMTDLTLADVANRGTSRAFSALWAAAVSQNSARVAIETAGFLLTFCELSNRAEAVSRELRASSAWRSGLCVAVPSDDAKFVERCVGVWLAHGVAVPFNRVVCAGVSELRSALSRVIDLSFDDQLRPESPSFFLADGTQGESPYHAIFFTSGSTGSPRAVLRGWTQALSEAQEYAREIGLAPGVETQMFIDPAFGASTKHLLGCLLSGASVALSCCKTDGVRKAEILYLTPSQLLSLRGSGSEPHGARLISCTGEPLSPAAWHRAQSLLETGGVCLNAVGGSEFGVIANQLLFASSELSSPRGRVPAQKRVRIVDEEGLEVPAGVPGLVEISSRFLALGYIDLQERTPRLVPFSEGRDGIPVFASSDIGILHELGDLELLGRATDIVKRGGRWIDVRPLRRFVEEFEGVTGCHIDNRPAPNSIRLVVEGMPPQSLKFESLVLAVLQRYIGDPLLPAEFLAVQKFPRNRHGKVDMQALKQIGASLGGGEVVSSAEIIAEALCGPGDGMRSFSSALSLVRLGVDSLALHEISIALERRLGRPVSISEILYDLPLGELGARLRTKGSGGPVHLPAKGRAETRLIWLGDGIGNLRSQLPDSCDVFHWDSDGLVPKHAYHDWQPLPSIVDAILSGIESSPPARPTVVGGFSFGALLALFVAAQLEARDQPPARLFLVDPPRIQLDPVRKLVRLARCYGAWILGGSLAQCRILSSHPRWAKEARRRTFGAHLPKIPGGGCRIYANHRYLPSTANWAKKTLSFESIVPLPTTSHVAVVSNTSIAAIWGEEIAQALKSLSE